MDFLLCLYLLSLKNDPDWTEIIEKKILASGLVLRAMSGVILIDFCVETVRLRQSF